VKLSQKFKQTIKKNLIIALVICALISSTLATFKLADFSMNSNNSMYTTALAETSNEENSSNNVRLANTDTITYIYDAADLVAFRDAVNAGDNFSGKTVYLMNDIDMSTVCSSTIGSFTPIGATGTNFAGTFDGNYHKISNLYISSNSYTYLGFFIQLPQTAIVQNVIMENIYIINTHDGAAESAYAGGITAICGGVIQNCGINSGSITGKKTIVYSGSHWPGATVGGIVAVTNNTSTIKNCYNKANITAVAPTSKNHNVVFIGGVIGASHGKVENCYNTGNVSGTAYYAMVGGVIGDTWEPSIGYLKNSYNTGTVSINGTTKNYGGLVGRNGCSSSNKASSISNSYCLNNIAYGIHYWNGSKIAASTSYRVAADTLKTYTVTLGNEYAYDVYNQNNGYPVLAWQNNTTVMKLNKNQAYISVQENLQLNVVESDEVTQKIGTNYANSNFKWTSTNEDVAIVNNQGVVKGISDGYTTVYAYHEDSGLYAMAVINVAKNFTNPQIETGNGFTIILKSDGTVYTIGNNATGQLGNGTTESTNVPVQVHIDEDTVLSNIVKIAVGTDHVVALTNDGKVYSWGQNTYGQLGQNDTTSSNYAKIVLGTDGQSYLTGIVDISASAYGSMALDKNGNVYVWGNGSNGEIGDKSTNSKYLPTKTTIENAIQVSIGQGQVGVLTSEGVVWSWGRNNEGQLGINCTKSTSYPMKTALNVTELTIGGFHTTVKKIDGSVYAVGAYSYGRLGTSSTANATKYVSVNLPSTVTQINKVKYVKAGRMNTTLLLTDGTVWETGFNLNGELGNGTTTNSTQFVQGLTKDGTLQDVLIIGRNNGDSVGSATTWYGLNTSVIKTNGDIYTTGKNSFGQIGDNTTNDTSFYTKMEFIYLDYEDKTVEISEQGYQIDKNKLKYIYSVINVYNNEQTYSVRRSKIYIVRYNNSEDK